MEWNQMLTDQDFEEKKLSEDCNKKYDVYLAGTCNNSTWREELIKKLYKNEGSDNMLQVTRMLNNELRLKHKEGIREGILKVARNLLKKKVDISEIKELTGLTEEEIMNIKI